MLPKQKVYQGVLQEIQNFIEINQLNPGDKLPSERELAEKLGAGRSSVREALRAMELLGIIETRHGEGTFLSKYRAYQTVEILSSFVLKENTSKLELLEVKRLLEKEAAKLVFSHMSIDHIDQLHKLMDNPTIGLKEQHVSFFQFVFELTENRFFARIWGLIDEYTSSFNVHYSKEFYYDLLQLYKDKNYQGIEDSFSKEKITDMAH